MTAASYSPPLFAGKVRAGPVLGRDGAQPQRADVVAARQFGLRQNFRPREHGVAGKQRIDVTAAIDRGDMKCVGQAR